ncbi:uncharacterized protein LOC111112176 [Crassostrea virginica]
MEGFYLCLGLITISFAYENIALNKSSYQQYPYPDIPGLPSFLTEAHNAVDGLKTNLSVFGGQCVISGNEKRTATWWVNLTSILSIHHITIYYRTENVPWGLSGGFTGRFLGFSLYISNTTNKSDGVLCFKDTSFTQSTIPSVFDIPCPVHGQYVIYFNERSEGVTYPDDYSTYAFNELCEVEVFGCPVPGYYGTACSIPCPDPNCRYCHIETGSCQGCKPGTRGHRCEIACPYGFFGQDCVNSCNNTCKGCNTVNGVCDTGCFPGWNGKYCHEKCDKTYGPGCTETCGHCLDSKPCHHINGSCVNGCAPGFLGDTCMKECENGYGLGCRETCGDCLDSKQCDHINGSCVNGCEVGFKGDTCKEVCDSGYYGVECLQECSSFCKLSKNCHHVSGHCKDGCKKGWQGMDFFEVESEKQSFYGVLGVLCGSLLLNGIFIAYIVILRKSRIRRSNQHHTKTKTLNTIVEEHDKNISNVNDEYQELGEIGKSDKTYDVLSE